MPAYSMLSRKTMTYMPATKQKHICSTILFIAIFLLVLQQPQLTKYQVTTSSTKSSKENPRVISNLLTKKITDPWKRSLYKKLDYLQHKCGQLCSINDMETLNQLNKGKNNENDKTVQLSVPVNCDNLFEMKEIDDGDLTFPYPLPKELLPLYTLNRTIPVHLYKRFKSAYLGGEGYQNIWTKEEIDNQILSVLNGTLRGTYKHGSTNNVRDLLVDKMNLREKSVLVIGSERPWLEVCALAAGASKVTTLEYGQIVSHHPNISTLTPDTFRKAYKEKKLKKFDVVLSFSSLEHSGLGRYGDALNPWGDILSLARAWCVTKDEGHLMLGLPTGQDSIQWNAHRVYGNIRWPLVTINWSPIDGVVDFSGGEVGKIDHIHYAHIFRKAP